MMKFILTLALLGLAAASVPELGTDDEIESALSNALGMINENADGSFSMNHEDHLTALLETDVAEANHKEEAVRMHATIENTVASAIHETMVEHNMHTSKAKVKGFFADLFNCVKCKSTSGSAGMSMKKMFMDDTKAIDLKREAVLKKAFTKPCNKTAFVKVLADLQKTLPLGPAGDPASSTVWAKHQKLDAHALINNANTLRWWKDVTNADFEGIFDSITIDAVDYTKELKDECEDLDAHDTIIHNSAAPGTAMKNGEKCAALRHCMPMLTTSTLTAQDKLICAPRQHVIEEMREIKAKAARAAAKGKALKVTVAVAVKNMLQELKEGEETQAEKAVDMEIGAGNALEWQVAGPGGFDPVPNLMRSYVCTPKDPSKFDLAQVHHIKSATAPPGTEAEAAAGAEASKDGQSGLKPAKEASMLTKVVNKVKTMLGNAFVRVKAALKTLWRMMYTAMRCGVCVICSLIEELVAFFAKMGARLKVLMKAIGEGIKKCAAELYDTGKAVLATATSALFGGGMRAKDAPEFAEKELCVLDSDCQQTCYCGKRENLIQKRCRKKNEIKAGKACYDKDDKGKGRDCEAALFCVEDGMFKPSKCGAVAPKASSWRRRRLLVSVVRQNRKLGVARAAKLRKKMHRLQHMHRVLSEIVKKQGNGQLSRDHIEASLMTKHAAKLMISKTVSMMHAHSATGKKAMVRRAATTMGGPLASLPNACVSEVNLGSGIGIAVNVENPNLLKMLAKVAKNAIGMFSLPLPDILIGITPTTFDNEVSDPSCLAAVSARSANNGKGVPMMTLKDGVDADNSRDALSAEKVTRLVAKQS